MTVQDVITYVKYSELSQLAIKDDSVAVMSFINLGMIELYKRFNLGIKVEIVRTNPLVSVYNLRNVDINKVITVYDAEGKTLVSPTSSLDDTYDYTQIGTTTFLLKTPKEEEPDPQGL